MFVDEARNLLKKRAQTDDEWVFGLEKCWEEEINFFTHNIEETINFLENDCTADEFSWLSEVFDEIVEKTQSREFIECLKKVARKYPEEVEKYNLMNMILLAEQILE